MADTLDTIDQIKPGFMFEFDSITQEEKWEAWYHGRYETLYPPPTIDNGLSLLAPALPTVVPLFYTASTFYVDATMAERPIVSGDDMVLDWLVERADELWDTMERAVRHWSIKGRFIMVSHTDGSVEAVDPTMYFRVGSFHNPDDSMGHVLAFRYREPESTDELLFPGIHREPNRVRVVRYQKDGVNDVQVFMLQNRMVGMALGSAVPAGITSIITAGNGDSWYPLARGLVADFCVQRSMAQREINRFQNRLRILPPSMLASITPPGSQLTPSALYKQFLNTVSPAVSAAEPGEEAIGATPEELSFGESQEWTEYTAQIFYLVCGMPPTSFGVGIGKGESGYAREKAQDAAGARIRSLRRQIARGLPALIRGMGAPDGDISFQWSTSPFEDQGEKRNAILQQLAAGIINHEEAREALGWTMARAMGESSRTVNSGSNRNANTQEGEADNGSEEQSNGNA